MGSKTPSTATLHTKHGWKRESVATFNFGTRKEGEGNASPTPVSATPCRYAAKTWMAASETPRSPMPVAGAVPFYSSLPPVGPTHLTKCLVLGGRSGGPLPPFFLKVGVVGVKG